MEKQGDNYCGRLRVRARKRERSIAIIKVLIAPPVANKKRFRRLLSRGVLRWTCGVTAEARLIGR